jgi:hypothetical protein
MGSYSFSASLQTHDPELLLVDGLLHSFARELRIGHGRSLVLGDRHRVRLELELCGELRVGHADPLIIGRLAYPFRLELIVWHRHVHGRSLVISGLHRVGFSPWTDDLDRP